MKPEIRKLIENRERGISNKEYASIHEKPREIPSLFEGISEEEFKNLPANYSQREAAIKNLIRNKKVRKKK